MERTLIGALFDPTSNKTYGRPKKLTSFLVVDAFSRTGIFRCVGDCKWINEKVKQKQSIICANSVIDKCQSKPQFCLMKVGDCQ